MKRFSELGIKQSGRDFTGEKIKMSRILNKEIAVLDFKIDKSKFENSSHSKCLTLQIEIEGEKRIVFTGSKVLTNTMKQIDKKNLPFLTTITKEGESYQFN